MSLEFPSEGCSCRGMVIIRGLVNVLEGGVSVPGSLFSL